MILSAPGRAEATVIRWTSAARDQEILILHYRVLAALKWQDKQVSKLTTLTNDSNETVNPSNRTQSQAGLLGKQAGDTDPLR